MPLPRNAPASAWIHDFVHSTNPKFEGKSRKERIRMALGAYYGHHKEDYIPECESIYEGTYKPEGAVLYNGTPGSGSAKMYHGTGRPATSCKHCEKVIKHEMKGGLTGREALEIAQQDHEHGHASMRNEESVPMVSQAQRDANGMNAQNPLVTIHSHGAVIGHSTLHAASKIHGVDWNHARSHLIRKGSFQHPTKPVVFKVSRHQRVPVREEIVNEVSPPGWEGTVKHMKKHKGIKNPWALAWSMKKKGYTSHVKEENNFHDSLNCRACKHIVKKEMAAGKPYEYAHHAALQHSIAFPHIHGSYATTPSGKTIHKEGVNEANTLRKKTVALTGDRKAKKSDVPCMWFAGCDHAATGHTPHSVLGPVPTCNRCHKFATGEERK